MKNIVSRWFKMGLFGSAALLAVSACSEDHFDIHDGVAGEHTIWENISNNAQLSDFAAILKRTKVMKREDDRVASLRASELLSQSQSFTLWAPVNGAFDAKRWNDSLDVAEKLHAQNDAAATKRALQIEYMVWTQFVANHLARFNYAGLSKESKIRLLNNKYGQFTGDSFNGISVTNSVASNNGALHTIAYSSPFTYNIYDFFDVSPLLSDINAYVKRPSINRNEFVESSSTPGAMNEEGKMVYIDSAYYRYNELLEGNGAQLKNEDSTYVAFLPTNNAWKQAIDKISPLFNYGKSYNWQFERSETGLGRFAKTDEKRLRLDTLTRTTPRQVIRDSLQQEATRRAIVRNLFFAPYRILGGQSMDSSALISYVNHADSLIATTGMIYYNPAAVKGQPNAHQNPSLQGLQPYRASNGYIFQLNEYGFDPAYSIVSEEKYQPIYTNWIGGIQNGTTSVYVLNENNHNEYTAKRDSAGAIVKDTDGNPVMTGVKGEVKNNTYVRFKRTSDNQNLVVDLCLPKVYSAAYTIELVMAPSKINFDVVNDPETDNEFVQFDAQIIADDDAATPTAYRSEKVTISQANGQFSQDSVQVVTLWKNLTFKKCYVDLPGNEDTFPRLRLTVPAKGGRLTNITDGLNIIEVRLKPYRQD